MTDQDQGQDQGPQQTAATTPGFTTSQPSSDNAFASAPQGYKPPARNNVTDLTTGDSAPDPRPPAPTPNPGIMDFITGKNAADPRQLTALVDAAKRAGASSDSEAVIHAIGTAPPEQQGSLIQTARILSDAGLGHAGAASNAGDLDRSGKFATAAMGYIPDGNNVQFQAGKDGMTATVTGLGDTGKTQSFMLDPQAWHNYITGPDVKFDLMMDGNIQQGLARAGGSGGTQEGGSAVRSQQDEAAGPPNLKGPYGESWEAEDHSDGELNEVTGRPKKGWARQNPATQDQGKGQLAPTGVYDPRADDPNALYGENVPGSNAPKGSAYIEWHKAQMDRSEALSHGGGSNPESNKAAWDAHQQSISGKDNGGAWGRDPTFTNPDDKTEAELKASGPYIPPNSTAPPRTNKFGLNSEAAGDVPSMEQQPGKYTAIPGGQSTVRDAKGNVHTVQNPPTTEYEPGGTKFGKSINERNASNTNATINAQSRNATTAENNKSRESIAAENNQSREGIAVGQNQSRENISQTVATTARQKIQQMLQGETDKTRAENLRTAVTNLGNAEKSGNTDVGSSIKAMRAAGLGNDVIGPLLRSTPQRQPQEDSNAQQAPAPKKQHTILPVGATSIKDGVLYTKGQDGQWSASTGQ